MTPEQKQTPPDDAWTRSVCLVGQGRLCCRYLTMSAHGWCCEKHSGLATLLDARVASGSMMAQGDNCEGRHE